MKRLLKRVSIITAVMLLVIAFAAPHVAAAASVTISGGDNVKGGDTFYVAVTFGGGDVGRVDAQITYDTSKLTYLSGGTSTGDAGYINLSKAGTNGSVTFNIEFQALKDGSTNLKLTTFDLFDLDEMPMDEFPSSSKTINIKGNIDDDQMITQETSPEEPEEPTELIGVDEMEDEGGANITVILILIAAVLVLLIVIVSVSLGKKKKKSAPEIKKQAPARQRYDHEYKKQANEETEIFDDWTIKDDSYDDIDKW